MCAAAAVRAQAPLAGRHVLVTRPQAQAAGLALGIKAAGGIPVLFPVLSISAVDDPAPVLATADRLDSYHLAVFVSPNAVDHALDLILPRRPWPASLPVATVGKGSERALVRRGFARVIAPQQRYDSEALLALPELQDDAIRGRRVVVFRGDGGRELLGQTLQSRGARVDYVTCYRRGGPEGDPAALCDILARGALDAVTVTSSEGLRNLWSLLAPPERAALAALPLFAPHERIAEQARELGIEMIVLTGPGDAGLLEGLSRHFSP